MSVSAILLVLLPVEVSRGEQPGENGKPPIPIYITPYYDSKGPEIAVGEPSQKLAAADARSILQIASELKKEQEKLRAEVMYVLAIRLYDLGHKDESVYWFYAAQYRARLFRAILDQEKIGSLGDEAFELQQAYNAFNQLAGTYINGYAFGELPKLEKTLAKVREEGKGVPRYRELYPAVSFAPEETWPDKNEEVAKGLAGLIDYIQTNAASIREQRRANGIEGKY